MHSSLIKSRTRSTFRNCHIKSLLPPRIWDVNLPQHPFIRAVPSTTKMSWEIGSKPIIILPSSSICWNLAYKMKKPPKATPQHYKRISTISWIRTCWERLATMHISSWIHSTTPITQPRTFWSMMKDTISILPYLSRHWGLSCSTDQGPTNCK